MNIADWLPALPWEGPPLPRFLGLRWLRQSERQLISAPLNWVTSVELKETERVKEQYDPLLEAKLMNDAVEGWLGTKEKPSVEWSGSF